MRYPPASASEALQFSPTQNQYQQHPRRPQLGHHATTYDSPSPGDDIRVRGLAHRHSRDPSRASSTSRSRLFEAPRYSSRARDDGRNRPVDLDDRPAPIARHRDAEPRPHHSRRRSRSPSHNLERSSYCAPESRQRSRDRHRGRSHRLADSLPRNHVPKPRERFRDHEALRSPDFGITVPHVTNGTYAEKAYPSAIRSRSSLVHYARQRTRSRSPVAPNSHTRQPRRVSCPRRSDWEGHAPRLSPWPPLADNSPPREYLSTRRESRHLKGFGRSVSPPPADTRRSQPSLSQGFDDNPNLAPLGLRPSSRFKTSDYPSRTLRPQSPRRRISFSSQAGRYSAIQDISAQSRRTPDFSDERQPPLPPLPSKSPPRESRELFPFHSRSTRGHLRREARPPNALATGVNIIEVNMSGRGSFRGNYGGQYPVRGHYNQGPNDQRNFAHSTSGSSFQGSPSAQSPYPSSRGSWGGQQQASPQK